MRTAMGGEVVVSLSFRVGSLCNDSIHKPLFDLFKFMNRHGMYWGAFFGGGVRYEDAMHFEVSTQVADQWLRNGIPSLSGSSSVPPSPAVDRCKASFGSKAVCKHKSTCRGTLERGYCPGDANNLCCHSEPPAVQPTPKPTPSEFYVGVFVSPMFAQVFALIFM